jgi:hypothetical protein
MVQVVYHVMSNYYLDGDAGLIIYDCLHQSVLEYLTPLCDPVDSITGRRRLRSAAGGELDFPRTKTKTRGPRNFAVAGPIVWNSLSVDVRDK